MDRKYLSVPEVVRLSESFVCARLLSYEDAAEAEFLRSVFRGRGGELENTVFCILDSDGETPLVRAGRSPDFLRPSRAGEVDDLLAALERVLAERRVRAKPRGSASLPTAVDLRRALNTAACDGLPVVALRDDVPSGAFSSAIWSNGLAGDAVYVRVAASAMAELPGAEPDSELVVIEPDRFGLEGRVSAQLSKLDDFDPSWWFTALASFEAPAKDAREHVRLGRRAGVEWETEIPVSDSRATRSPRPR